MVGSERESRTSATVADFGWIEILDFSWPFRPRGPSTIGRSMGEFTPKKSLKETGILRSCLSYLHTVAAIGPKMYARYTRSLQLGGTIAATVCNEHKLSARLPRPCVNTIKIEAFF